MSTTPSLFERLRTAIVRLFAGRRLSHGDIVDGVRLEAIAAVSPKRPTPTTTDPELVTAFASSFPATWTLPRLVASKAGLRQKLRDTLAQTHDRYIRAVTAGRLLHARPELKAVKAEYERLVETAFSAPTTVRAIHLARWVYLLTVVMVAVVDTAFFAALLSDIYQVSPSADDYWAVVIPIFGLALLTPVAVVLVSEWGGRRFARMRVEIREELDARAHDDGPPVTRPALRAFSIGAVPLGVLVMLTGLTYLFYIVGEHRFAELLARPGAIDFPAEVPAALIALLPVVSFLASVFSHDLDAKHRLRVSRQWKALVQESHRHQDAVRDAKIAWEASWGQLYALVGSMVAEGNLSVQTLEHLVLRGIALANQRLETAYTLQSVVAKSATQDDSIEELIAKSESTGRPQVVPPVRQVSTTFTSAEWVLDELEIDLQWLMLHRPSSLGSVEQEVSLLMQYSAHSPLADGPVDLIAEPAADTGEDADPVSRDRSSHRGNDRLDTADLELLLDAPPSDRTF